MVLKVLLILMIMKFCKICKYMEKMKPDLLNLFIEIKNMNYLIGFELS